MSLQKKKKKKKKAKKKKAAKVILITDGEEDKEQDRSVAEEDSDEEDEDDEGGMHFEKEDALLIYNALKNYKPTGKEQVLYETWLEMFEEMLVVDYGVKLPGFEDFDEDD